MEKWNSRHVVFFCVLAVFECVALWFGKLPAEQFVTAIQWTGIAFAGGHGWSKLADKK